MPKAEEKIRKQAVDELLQLARKIAREEHWFIGSFLARVREEWNEREPNKKARKK